MEEDKVKIPPPPPRLRTDVGEQPKQQSLQEEQQEELEKTDTIFEEELVRPMETADQPVKQKVEKKKIRGLVPNIIGLVISVAAVAVFVFLIVKG